LNDSSYGGSIPVQGLAVSEPRLRGYAALSGSVYESKSLSPPPPCPTFALDLSLLKESQMIAE
jgi:hypothetical protein